MGERPNALNREFFKKLQVILEHGPEEVKSSLIGVVEGLYWLTLSCAESHQHHHEVLAQISDVIEVSVRNKEKQGAPN